MTWDDFVADWPYAYAVMKRRFHAIAPVISPFVCDTKAAFAAYVADRHNLTLAEAITVIDEVLDAETLRSRLIDDSWTARPNSA